ncbi:MAG: MFS transporter [Acidobacteriota bacterium]
MTKAGKLLTFEFVSLNCVSFFAFCNLSVFYGFYTYLGRIGIPEEWRGFLLGLEPMTAFALRLAVVPLLHGGNAATAMLVSLVMIIVALCSYSVALTIPALVLLRIFHGAAFVVLVSSSMAMVVHFIPKERSAQGFSIVSLSSLIPYAVMPLVVEFLLRRIPNEAHIYALVSILGLPGIVLLHGIRPRLRRAVEGMGSALVKRPTAGELFLCLRQRDVLLLLCVSLLLYFCHATVFFFMKTLVTAHGFGNPGLFFSISTAAMILVRLLGGALLDRVNRLRVLSISALLLSLCLVLLARATSPLAFSLVALFYGTSMSGALPLLTAVLFRISPPQLRGINTNLALFMMDGGYILGTYIGGLLLAAGWSPSSPFYASGGLALCATLLLLATREDPADA